MGIARYIHSQLESTPSVFRAAIGDTPSAIMEWYTDTASCRSSTPPPTQSMLRWLGAFTSPLDNQIEEFVANVGTFSTENGGPPTDATNGSVGSGGSGAADAGSSDGSGASSGSSGTAAGTAFDAGAGSATKGKRGGNRLGQLQALLDAIWNQHAGFSGALSQPEPSFFEGARTAAGMPYMAPDGQRRARSVPLVHRQELGCRSTRADRERCRQPEDSDESRVPADLVCRRPRRYVVGFLELGISIYTDAVERRRFSGSWREVGRR